MLYFEGFKIPNNPENLGIFVEHDFLTSIDPQKKLSCLILWKKSGNSPTIIFREKTMKNQKERKNI